VGMRARVRDDDRGAVAVEFALVSVLLFTLLFGIIQYGFLFFQYQAAAATVHDAARRAGTGLNPFDDGVNPPTPACQVFTESVLSTATGNGLPEQRVANVTLDWGSVIPVHGSSGTVSLRFKPTGFGTAFVPTPDEITVQAVATAEELGTELGGCNFTQSVSGP
jgi:TadE-like protein